jgi:tetratricopeptide (TPR) repeat protein
VWGETVVEENNLAHNISVLRKVLRQDPSRTFAIETIPRRGYCLREASQPTPAAEMLASAPGPQLVSTLSDLAGRSIRRWLKPAVIAGVLLCSAAASLYLTGFRTPGTVGRRQSVAIIGFVNLSHQPDSAWLSRALAEMIATELAAGGQLLTISNDSVARAKAELKLDDRNGFSAETLARLRRDLHAELIVSGAYAVLPSKASQGGDAQIRLDLRVQDATRNKTLDALSEVGQQSSLFDLVARAGMRVRQDLGAAGVTPEQAQQARLAVSSNPQAVRLYAEGIEKLRSFDALGARAFLQQAVEVDPQYALAHSALAEALDALGHDQASNDEAKIAFELSGDLSPEERLSIEGRYRVATRDRKRAIDVYRKLVDSFPDNLDYGLMLASAQIETSDARSALSTLNSLGHSPGPEGSDPRITLKEYEVWKSVGDYGRAESSLVEAANLAERQGASLLLARARVRQCWVRLKLAKKQQATTDCQKAQQIYAAVGDRRGEADALRLLGQLASSSDVPGALNYYRRALAIEQEIGHLAGQAAVTNQIAILYSNQGDHVAAKNSYEQALAVFRQLDSKPDSIGLLINVGIESVALGEIEQAEKMYHDALALGSEIGNKDIEGLAEQNIGQLRQAQGDVRAAKISYQRALKWFQEAADTAQAAATMNFLGEVATAGGDLDAARKLFKQALTMQEPSHRGLTAVESEMDLAELSLLDMHACPAELRTSLLHVREAFHNGGSVDGEAQAVTLLASCQLAEGQSAAALDAIEEAAEISSKSEPDVRLLVAVAADRIRFASQGSDTATQALAGLGRTITAARRRGFIGVELEARLALGEIEVRSGATIRGRAHLQAVERDASSRGLLLIARKARAAA